MILSKKIILQEASKGNIILDSVKISQIKDQSVDVSLGQFLYIYNTWIDITKPFKPPLNTLILAYTDEFIGTTAGSNLLPAFKLKSTAGRQGIFHTLAGHGEVGYFNRWAMEFVCFKKIELQKGMLIGQIYFNQVIGAGDEDYSTTGTYQKSNNPEEVKATWTKESILPPKLKLK
jgi:deoxycytidine triphosphate deaminase